MWDVVAGARAWTDLKRRLLRRRASRAIAAAVDAARGVLPPSLLDVIERRFERLTPEERRQVYAAIDERAIKDHYGLAYAEWTFDGQRRCLERELGSLQGLRILEIGPGFTVAGGILYYVHGACRYVAIDLFPVAARDAGTYRALRRDLGERPLLTPVPDGARLRTEALRRFDEAVAFDEASGVLLDEDKVAYHAPVDVAHLPYIDGSFDVVLSNASFEHFLDPHLAIRECTRVLAPGGLQVHQIDLRDHRDFSRPLRFLRHSDDEWRAMNRDVFSYTNRMRKIDFERAFAAAGNEVRIEVHERCAAPTAEERAGFDARFRDLPADDLEALSVKVFARRLAKPAPARALRLAEATT